jgi:hypothetical protein
VHASRTAGRGAWAYLVAIEPHGGTRPLEIELRAFETIEQARARVLAEVRAQQRRLLADLHGDLRRAIVVRAPIWRRLHKRATALTIFGGTVGPLPDGTVLDVRPIALAVLLHEAVRYDGGEGQRSAPVSRRAIVAAFNRAQRQRRAA